MTDDRGQALVVAVFVLAIAIAAVIGLRAAQEAVLAASRERRAGEAAIAAATAVIADAYAAELGTAAARSPSTSADVRSAVTAPAAREAARVAASGMSIKNGGAPVSAVSVSCVDGAVAVTIAVRGVTYRAGFGAPECSRP